MGSLAPDLGAPLRVRPPLSVPTVAVAALLGGAAVAALFFLLAPSAGGWAVPVAWIVSCVLAGVVGARWAGARRAVRMRRDFAAGMSHDLRTPLAQIQMFTEMLLMGRDRCVEERTAWLEVIERESHALGSLIDNLLLLAHGPDPAPFPAREPLDLGSLIEDVSATYASRAAARGMRIVADPPAGVVVRADPRAIRQAVANLLDNALRFGPDGQKVVVSVSSGCGQAELAVEDQGPGLPPEDRARFLGPSGLRHQMAPDGGRGLGLAVVAHVVHAHGGRTAVEEVSGGGARVRVVLPLASPAAPAAVRQA